MAKNSKNKPLTAPPNELLKTIFSYVGRIADERDIDQLLILLADMGRDLISADRCTVWLLNRKTDELWSRVAHGLDRITIPCSAGIAGCVAMTGESLIINDPYHDSRFDKDVDKKTGYHTRNILGLPIHDGEGKIIGVFQAINKMPEPQAFSEQDLDHLLLAATYTGKALDAAMLQEEIEATQREIIFTLAETGELRSKETGFHVKRVAEFCRLFAEKHGLSADETELLRLSSPMHDIGKIAIPDSILLKPGKLTPEEWDTMKTHTTLGHEMLKHSERRLLKAAALIADEHHERWDGTGYPSGKKGEAIHIFGRITAMSDVFDALANTRVYKPAWELERIVELFKEEKGHQFDPKLVKVFLDNLDEFVKIKETYKDEPPAMES
ncbi:MAG: HD domain-containing protein [Spirochaetaceae bacterium]|nr:MAG: HD domain-containing protein [Spirochaetaceae bacterium]